MELYLPLGAAYVVWTVILGSLLIIACEFLQTKWTRHTYQKYPVIADRSWLERRRNPAQDTVSDCLTAYQKYQRNNKSSLVWLNDDLVLVPPRELISEIVKIPSEKMSFRHFADDILLFSSLVGDTFYSRKIHETVLKFMVPRLPQMTEYLSAGIHRTLESCLRPAAGSTSGWQTTTLFAACIDIANRTMAPVLVGDRLGYQEEFVRDLSDLVALIPAISGASLRLPSFLRHIYYKFSTQGRKAHHLLQRLKSTAYPEFAQLCSELSDNGKHGDLPLIGPMLSLGTTDKVLNRTLSDEIMELIIIIQFAASGMLAIAQAQLILYYLAYPAFQSDLRDEVNSAFQQHQGWSKETILAMPKLDSFIRETLRLSPPVMYTVQRKAMQDITIPGGATLPAGQKVMAPTFALMRDPDIYCSPDSFDPYRFYDPINNKPRVQAATQSVDYAPFGFGSQACPGRAFAILWLKLMFATLIKDYEMKFSPDQSGTEKPPDLAIDTTLMPNPEAVVAFRRR